MTTQGVLVESVFSGLTGEVGNFVNKRISGGRVAFHPSGGGNTYKNVYASANVSGSTLLDQSVNQGILLDGSGSAEVYAVGHYLCKAYDSEGVLQRTFDLRIGSVTSDSSGDSAVSTSTLNIKSSYGTNASDINNAITYANANSANSFVFLFEDANFTLENNMIFPSNATIQVEPTAKLMIYAGVNSITINGEIRHDFNQIFKYENNTTCTVTISPKAAEHGYPQWFGAIPDGTSDSRFAVDRLLQTGINRVVIAGGNFKLNSNLTIPSTVEIIRKGGADFTLANGVTITGLGTKATVFDKVEVKQDIIPTTTETSDIGSSTKKIQKIYTKDIKLGNGTLTDLALSAISDPNTGLYFPAADVLALVTGGVEGLGVDANGNVGIGTSSPKLTSFTQKTLTVSATGKTLIEVVGNGSGSDVFVSGISFHNQASSSSDKRIAQLVAYRDTDDDAGALSFYTVDTGGSLTEKMKITSSGHVGLGNTIANIIGAVNNGGHLVVGAGQGNEGITVYSGTNTYGVLYFADGTTGSDTYRGWISYHHSGDYLTFATSSIERMRIDSAGKVFIPSLGTGSGTGLSVTSGGEIVKDSNVTQQGNSFNAANQLVKLDANQDVSIGGKVTATGGIDAGGSGTFLKTKVIDIGTIRGGFASSINHNLTFSKIVNYTVMVHTDSGTSLGSPYANLTAIPLSPSLLDYDGASSTYLTPTAIRVSLKSSLFSTSSGNPKTGFSNSSQNRGKIFIQYMI